ncbi:hypothetical protein Q3C01_30780 [Bradyrhizobium sp. UFLA05-109]
MNESIGDDLSQARSGTLFRPAAWGSVFLLLACAWSSSLSANPAIANNPPCNSAKIGFRPTARDEARALAFVRSLPGVGRIEKNNDGSYGAEFAGPNEINALIADLNQHHAAEVIDLFQYFQCNYRLF